MSPSLLTFHLASPYFSFAVGNAAFHSGELYPQLKPSVAPLCVALRDPDEKTRANAAGSFT